MVTVAGAAGGDGAGGGGSSGGGRMSRLREWWENVHTLLWAFHPLHTPMLVVLRDGWRLRAMAIGWEDHDYAGKRIVLLSRVYIAPRYRGHLLRTTRELLRAWTHEMRERGITQTLTPVDKSRPEVGHLGARVAGYRYYGEDGRFIWYSVDI